MKLTLILPSLAAASASKAKNSPPSSDKSGEGRNNLDFTFFFKKKIFNFRKKDSGHSATWICSLLRWRRLWQPRSRGLIGTGFLEKINMVFSSFLLWILKTRVWKEDLHAFRDAAGRLVDARLDAPKFPIRKKKSWKWLFFEKKKQSNLASSIEFSSAAPLDRAVAHGALAGPDKNMALQQNMVSQLHFNRKKKHKNKLALHIPPSCPWPPGGRRRRRRRRSGQRGRRGRGRRQSTLAEGEISKKTYIITLM